MEISGAYSSHLEVYPSEMSTKKLAELLKRPVEDIELMELQLTNAWVYEETGSYFEDLSIGPEWLSEIVRVRTEASRGECYWS